MAKGQMKGNKEAKKPKGEKPEGCRIDLQAGARQGRTRQQPVCCQEVVTPSAAKAEQLPGRWHHNRHPGTVIVALPRKPHSAVMPIAVSRSICDSRGLPWGLILPLASPHRSNGRTGKHLPRGNHRRRRLSYVRC